VARPARHAPGFRLFDPPKVGSFSPSGRTGRDRRRGEPVTSMPVHGSRCEMLPCGRGRGDSGSYARTGPGSLSLARAKPVRTTRQCCSPARQPRMARDPVSAMASMTSARPNRGLRPCARQKFAVPVRAERNRHGEAGTDEKDKQGISLWP